MSLALAAGGGINSVKAVHDAGAFELDGNAASFNAPPPQVPTDDWDLVSAHSSHATAESFSSDNLLNNGPSLQATIFTGGGSKDPIDINQWAWKDGAGGLPDKDNLLHSFAARYSLPPTNPATWQPGQPFCPNGTGGPGQPAFNSTLPCEVLFFGSDRYDNSGDAQQGFWFFQNAITLNTNPVGGGQGFSGLHRAGDLLIISDFSNGGGTSTISVYVWDPVCTATNKPDGGCGDANLRRLATSNAANCATAAPGDAFCGIVNPGPGLTPSPWPFQDKSGRTSFQNGEFYEGGVNLSVLGLAGECFASIASETRSSTSTTATLKDFVLGGFARCDSGLVTTPKDGSGGAIPPEGLSIGSGSVQGRDSAQITISGVVNWSGTLKFYLCGPIASGTCDSGGTQIGAQAGIPVSNATQQPVLSDPATITSAGRYCWRGEFRSGTSGVPNATDATAGECFLVNPVNPALVTNAVAGPVPLGTPISDTATLSQAASQPGSPVINPTTPGLPAGGTITFRLYGPGDPTCTTAPAYTSAAIPVSGNGQYPSGSFTPTVAGTYRWVASYTGNLPNTTGPISNACGDASEISVVSPNQPTIATVASAPPPGGVPVGTAISDTATLAGAAPPSNGVFGTITFRAYGPHANTATCTTLAYQSTLTVTGNGSYNSANGSGGTFTPTAPGNYNWIASYTPGSGDVNNLPVSGACGDANEGSLVIRLDPSVSTSQFFYPNDSATVTVAAGGGNLAGTVRFRVWTNADCTGTPLYDSTPLTIGGALTQTVETNNTTARVYGGSVYWQVDYVSTNPAHTSVPGTCGRERSTITVDNNFTPAP